MTDPLATGTDDATNRVVKADAGGRHLEEMRLKYLELRTAAGATAIRVPGVINAASVAVILGFMSNFDEIMDKDNRTAFIVMTVAISMYIFGVFFSALGSGYSYDNLRQLHEYYDSAISSRNYRLPESDLHSYTNLLDNAKSFIKKARKSVIISYVFFLIGSALIVASLLLLKAK